MSNKKDNFKRAAYDLFGVGAENPEAGQPSTAEEPQTDSAAPAASFSVPETAAVQEPAAPRYQTTILAEGSTFEGTLRAKGDVDLACNFRGDILSEGKVTMRTSLVGNVTGNCVELVDCNVQGNVQAATVLGISSHSVVVGDVKTQDLLCAGEIAGNIESKGHVILSSSAKLKGDLTAATLSIEQGAVIEGNLKVSPAGGKNK